MSLVYVLQAFASERTLGIQSAKATRLLGMLQHAKAKRPNQEGIGRN